MQAIYIISNFQLHLKSDVKLSLETLQLHLDFIKFIVEVVLGNQVGPHILNFFLQLLN